MKLLAWLAEQHDRACGRDHRRRCRARVDPALVIRRRQNRIVNGAKKKQNVDDTQALLASPLAAVRVVQRTRTLGSVLSNIVTRVIVIVVVLLLVDNFVPNATGAFALITAALGAGLGFGAQNIVKDVLNGIFIVVGGPARHRRRRRPRARDRRRRGASACASRTCATSTARSGTCATARSCGVGNMSQGWARVIIDLAVPYDADVDAVQDAMLETANELADEPKWRSRIIEKPEVWGIESISGEAIVMRLVMKTALRREGRRRARTARAAQARARRDGRARCRAQLDRAQRASTGAASEREDARRAEAERPRGRGDEARRAARSRRE